MIAPDQAHDQDILTLDLPLGLSIADLKGLVNAETSVPQSSQQFFLNNVPLQPDTKTLEEAGVKDGDMLAMLTQQQQQQPSQNTMGAQQNSRSQQSSRRQGTSSDEIETARLSILGNPGAMAQVREQRPALAQAINDPTRFREVWENMLQEDEQRERAQNEQMRLLNDDPFNVDAQRQIEEMIRQETVQKNLQHAYEHTPEVFGRVTMLYINVEVNGQPVKAFVDSGAQTTIMSPSCAEACNIMRLIDKRYSGIAKGVGTAQILGRVHSSEIKIGNAILPCSFTVMEGKDVDLLLGLDMLKRFQALIDLRRNKLVFGNGNEVDFLGEADIPRHLEEAQASEPTIAGPNGTEIGAQSGTVKPAGTSAAAAASSSKSDGAFKGPGQTLGTASSSSARPNASTPATNSNLPSNSTTTSSHPKEAIEQLQNLGFSRAEAIQALDACDGNVEFAAGLLFQG